MLRYNPVLLPKVRSKSIMAAAPGMPCTLRVASFVSKPCASFETNVMCHLPSAGKGTSTKSSDLFVACGCFACHAIVDGPDKAARDIIFDRYPTAYAERLLGAMQETLALLVQRGLIFGPDWEIIE